MLTGNLKKILSKTVQYLASKLIFLVDYRQQLSRLTIITPSTDYRVSFQRIFTQRKYFWMAFENITLDPLFYFEVPHANIVGNGIVVSSFNKVILESTLFSEEYFYKLHQSHLVFTRFFKKGIKLNSTSISLSYMLEDNYYHWIMESIGRVAIITGHFNLQNIKWIISDSSQSFKIDSLKFLFDIKESTILKKKTSDCYQCNLIVPSFGHTRNKSTQHSDILNPASVKLINSFGLRLSEKKKIDGMPTKFILSRSSSDGRRIVNEKLLVQKLGLPLVDTAKIPFDEQVHLFANAQLIVTTHGAGLTNIVFSRNISVVELFPEERHPRDAFVFTQISCILGFNHSIIEYTSVNESQDVTITDELLEKINGAISRFT